jgi:hypothetical protein
MTYKLTIKYNSFYYNLLPQGYMFRLLRVIIRPSNEPIQDYLITSALCDPVALKIGGVIEVVWAHVNRANYSELVKYIWLLYGFKVTGIMTIKLQDFSGSSLCGKHSGMSCIKFLINGTEKYIINHFGVT